MVDVVTLSLDEPLISNSSAASLMASEALPYVPGSVLHGLIQSQAYEMGKSAVEVFDKIINSDLWVSDAFPLDDEGKIGLPVPLSLFVGKTGHQFGDNGKLHPDVIDFSVQDWKPGHRQCAGAITADGSCVDVRMGASTRTAIELGTNRAEDGQLFELRYLEAGQRFSAFVKSKNLLEHLLPEKAQLGRSKSAEFGTVHLSWSEADLPDQTKAGPGERYIWFWSDFWPDCKGAVAFDSLFDGQVDWAHSHVRKRRYSNYNGTRKARTPEREVFTRGSVFRLSESTLPIGVQHIGLATEQGLGLAIVSTQNPLEIIRTGAFVPKVADNTDDKNSILTQETRLSQWIRAATTSHFAGPDIIEVKRLYESAETLAGYKVGPSAGQWGRIARAAAAHEAANIVAIMSTSEGEDNPSWGAAIVGVEPSEQEESHRVQNFRTWLERSYPILTDQDNDSKEQWRALAVLARDVRRRMQNELWLERSND